MKMIPMGEYYVWFCNWCDSTNQVHWSKQDRPDLTCAACHQEPNGTSAAEGMVVEAVRAGRDIPWARLYELPRHVYFTHRRHVTVARIACERCHGDMGAQARPPPLPLVALTMDGCIGCHRERHASRDCDVCHR